MSCAPPEGSSAGSRGNCFAPGRTAYCSAAQQQASSPPGNRRRKEKHETHISPGQTKPSLETEGTRKFRCSGKVNYISFISYLGFPDGSGGKESVCNEGDLGSIPGLGRSPGEGKGYPLQYSGLENPMDRIVHGVAKSRIQLSDFHFPISYPVCF